MQHLPACCQGCRQLWRGTAAASGPGCSTAWPVCSRRHGPTLLLLLLLLLLAEPPPRPHGARGLGCPPPTNQLQQPPQPLQLPPTRAGYQELGTGGPQREGPSSTLQQDMERRMEVWNHTPHRMRGHARFWESRNSLKACAMCVTWVWEAYPANRRQPTNCYMGTPQLPQGYSSLEMQPSTPCLVRCGRGPLRSLLTLTTSPNHSN
ncbi:hypothetical protein V8C86DRAFT_2517465 [Haematococcus lacustris]